MKMGFQNWLILALVVMSIYQYTYPEDSQDRLEPVFGGAKEFIKKNMDFMSGDNKENTVCPDTFEPVCGDNGKTYDNTCEAAMAGIMKVTMGEC